MNKNWHGIMKIIEAQQIRNGSIIWEEKNIYNTLHSLGEEFFLKCCFAISEKHPPENYYLGLDNRSTTSVGDIVSSLMDEPTGVNGYLRKPVNSVSGFTIELVSGVYRATSQIVSFSAVGGSWGPVSNIFLINTSTNVESSVLLATANLSSAITVANGDTINMRISLSLQDS